MLVIIPASQPSSWSLGRRMHPRQSSFSILLLYAHFTLPLPRYPSPPVTSTTLGPGHPICRIYPYSLIRYTPPPFAPALQLLRRPWYLVRVELQPTPPESSHRPSSHHHFPTPFWTHHRDFGDNSVAHELRLAITRITALGNSI